MEVDAQEVVVGHGVVLREVDALEVVACHVVALDQGVVLEAVVEADHVLAVEADHVLAVEADHVLAVEVAHVRAVEADHVQEAGLEGNLILLNNNIQNNNRSIFLGYNYVHQSSHLYD